MYNEQIESLIEAALADGVLTEKEKQILFKKAQSMGIDLDEFEMVLDARLVKMKKEEEEKAATSAPKSNKFGDVKKCPSCGAMVKSFTTQCPECGHEFSGIEANSSIQKLFELLNQAEAESRGDSSNILSAFGHLYADTFSKKLLGGTKDERKKKAIIQNFPIPNTKDDILEFLSLAVPLAKKPSIFAQNKDEMWRVWRAKCEQIIMKARFSMQDDKTSMDMIQEYAKILKIK